MKRIFLDANILVDYLSKSAAKEDAALAAGIVNYCLKRSIIMLVSTHSIMVLSYFPSKELKQKQVLTRYMSNVLLLFEVVVIEKYDIVSATSSLMSDFEDAVQLSCALKANANLLLTKNTGDFYGTSLPIIPPSQFFDFI